MNHLSVAYPSVGRAWYIVALLTLVYIISLEQLETELGTIEDMPPHLSRRHRRLIPSFPSTAS